MKLLELSELHLAAVVAGATFLGGFAASLLNTFVIDAGTERQTDVQLVQLAIGILSEPLPAREEASLETFGDAASFRAATFGEAVTPEAALRSWAVDTINATAEVQFDANTRALLITGEAQFGGLANTFLRSVSPDTLSKLAEVLEATNDKLRQLQSEGEDAGP